MASHSYGSLLSISEVGIGTLAHTFRIPFTGHLLSLNQLFILNLALCQQDIRQKPSLLIHATHIAAASKAITPSYKKITPIIAIYAQTLLFYGPVVLLKGTQAGQILGCLLSSLWAVVQGIASLYIVFGNSLFTSIQGLSFCNLTPEAAISIAASLILLKMALAVATMYIAKYITRDLICAYERTITQLSLSKNSLHENSGNSQLLSAFKDVCSLSFILPFGFILAGLWLQGTSAEGLLVFIARAAGAAFLLSLLSRYYLSPLIKKWLTQ